MVLDSLCLSPGDEEAKELESLAARARAGRPCKEASAMPGVPDGRRSGGAMLAISPRRQRTSRVAHGLVRPPHGCRHQAGKDMSNAAVAVLPLHGKIHRRSLLLPWVGTVLTKEIGDILDATESLLSEISASFYMGHHLTARCVCAGGSRRRVVGCFVPGGDEETKSYPHIHTRQLTPVEWSCRAIRRTYEDDRSKDAGPTEDC